LQEPVTGTNYYFVDESGDPIFYNRDGSLIVGHQGCSKILIMGFVETREPNTLRKALSEVRDEILNDPYFAGIPSIEKSRLYFHAKDDCPEVRLLVFKKLQSLEFKSQFIVSRKIEQVFRRRFDGKENKYYDHLITELFKNVLHRYETSRIYFSARGSSTRQKPIEQAIEKAIGSFEEKWKISIAPRINISLSAQSLTGEPCLQVIDYMNWAIYRAFINGEMRFFKTVESKISFLLDIYDTANYPKNYYNRDNPFDCKKISPI
jgi:hypothetical protein